MWSGAEAAKGNMPNEIVKSEDQQIARQSESADLLSVIARAAADPAVDLAKMEQLLQMQERVMAKQAEIAFNKAMTRLQPRLPRILKKGRIEFKGASQPYARYEDIMEAIGPLLADEGFSVSFGTRAIEHGIEISATLAHAMGHTRTAVMPLPFDTSGSKNSIQAVGSTMHYGKRYLLGALLNLVTVGEDDDANAVSLIDERQVNTLLDMFAACGMDSASESKFLQFMGVKTLGDIRRRDYEKAMTALRAKLRKRNEGRE
jgi:hypothetical protein